jgi:hypothetical protein
MSTPTLELERELQTMAPDTAEHFERAVREMLLLVRGKKTEGSQSDQSQYQSKPRDLGLRPGLSYDNIGELLSQVEELVEDPPSGPGPLAMLGFAKKYQSEVRRTDDVLNELREEERD